MPDLILNEVEVSFTNENDETKQMTLYNNDIACITDFNAEFSKDLINAFKSKEGYKNYSSLISVNSKSVTLPSKDSILLVTGKGRFKQSTSKKMHFSILFYLKDSKFYVKAIAPNEFVMMCLQEQRFLSSIGIFFITRPELFEDIQIYSTNDSSVFKKKSNCFIATAVYNDGYCPEVNLLRNWRDEVLSNNSIGKILIFTYRLIGPILAFLIKRRILSRKPFKFMFDNIVSNLQKKG